MEKAEEETLKARSKTSKLKVGDRVHWGVSCPDTGIITRFTKDMKYAYVKWDQNEIRRELVDRLFNVTRSLTAWDIYRDGNIPCEECEMREAQESRPICWVCNNNNAIRPRYTYRIDYSKEDECYIAYTLENIGIKAHGETAEEALRELGRALAALRELDT